jgi:hypothetical protein
MKCYNCDKPAVRVFWLKTMIEIRPLKRFQSPEEGTRYALGDHGGLPFEVCSENCLNEMARGMRSVGGVIVDKLVHDVWGADNADP